MLITEKIVESMEQKKIIENFFEMYKELFKKESAEAKDSDKQQAIDETSKKDDSSNIENDKFNKENIFDNAVDELHDYCENQSKSVEKDSNLLNEICSYFKTYTNYKKNWDSFYFVLHDRLYNIRISRKSRTFFKECFKNINFEKNEKQNNNSVNNIDNIYIHSIFKNFCGEEILETLKNNLKNDAYEEYDKGSEKYFQALGDNFELFNSQGALKNLANNYFKENYDFDFSPLNSLKQRLEEIDSLNLNNNKTEVDLERIKNINISVIKRNSHIQIGQHVANFLNKQPELETKNKQLEEGNKQLKEENKQSELENEKQILFEELPFSDFSQ